MTRLSDADKAAIREAYPVPPHIQAIAHACYYDLMHGPSWLRIPHGDVEQVTDDCLATFYDDAADEADPDDVIEETYTGRAADALRAFIDELPSQLWLDTDSGCISDREPDACWEDGDGEVHEEDLSSWWELDNRTIVEALFGRTIAREFR